MNKIPVGYQALIKQFKLNPIPHYRTSMVVLHGSARTTLNAHNELHEYSKSYMPREPDNPFAQLEFALKYDGINLQILALVFKSIGKQHLCAWIQERFTSKYTRMVWFLFEFLLEEKLDLPDCKKIKYIDLLDPNKYFTARPIKSSRHGINNNLLGNKYFCPIVRRTPILEEYINKKFNEQANAIIQRYEPNIIARANNYLLAKETMSSYEIEREKPDRQRVTRFMTLLEKAPAIEHLTKEILIECQNVIVDPRFIDVDYRHTQNYVGENINQYLQKIHYISPKPEDLPLLMEGLLTTLEAMRLSDCHPVIIAAVIAFGFVFLHPFEDGNGRLHRFLIHYILSRCHFTPPGVIFPISAIMLQNIREYDAILESFSKPLMHRIIEYRLDNDGVLTVDQETRNYYQHIDYTAFAEYLFSCIEETMTVHFTKEIEFLVNYDKTKHALQQIVDMPDNLIDLFIRCVIQNKGKLSGKKREKYFHALTQEELSEMMDIVASHMLSKN